MRKRKRYIYNWEQAYFYMTNGATPIEKPQIHFKTNKIFFVFLIDDIAHLERKWNENKNKTAVAKS